MLTAVADIGGVEVILDRIACGETMTTVAGGMGVSPAMLSEWLRSDPERGALLSQARTVAAQSLAEQSLTISDGASPEGVQVARLQVETRKWLASKYDVGTFGDKQTGVQINIGSLHLDALRKVQADHNFIELSPTESTA
ncbi:MAG: hypothetical protein WCP82_11200 [Alphaproteobacteria bacterium]